MKFFNWNKGPKLSKTSEMLAENLYWQLIDESLQNADDQDKQEEYLIQRLRKLTPAEIIGFRLRTDNLLYDSYTSSMWCAGYIMNGGCSDDGFEYFRCWIISRGKAVYYQAMADPDSLISQTGEGIEYDFESFWYVALEAFEKNTGKDLYDYIDNDKFTTTEGRYPPIEFTWKEEDPASMKALCPQLFNKMWEKW